MDTGRLAGAPISWGVCEVPGWGHQLSAQRVLSEMHELGLVATEFGPAGWLPAKPEDRIALLDGLRLRTVGGFLPVVLYDAERDPLPEVDAFVDDALVTDAEVVVLAAATGRDGYDVRPELTGTQWATLLANLDRLHAHVRSRGMTAALHPHVGTLVQNGREVRRIVDGSGVPLTLDTGHLLAGGSDPAELARRWPERIAHVHLKDVDGAAAARVAAGELAFSDGVRHGMFRPLGEGDVDVAGIVDALEGAGYQGWYVLEQDIALAAPPEGEGPVSDVRTSVRYLQELRS